jgi:hypothetical protein
LEQLVPVFGGLHLLIPLTYGANYINLLTISQFTQTQLPELTYSL